MYIFEQAKLSSRQPEHISVEARYAKIVSDLKSYRSIVAY
jgi:hypothetical protein